MFPTTPSNRTPISHLNPSKCLIRSNSDLQRLIARRSQPLSIDFRLEDHDRMSNIYSKKVFTFTSKKLCKLKNPPVKQSVGNARLNKHLRSLQLRPEDAAKYITQISKRFSKIKQLAIIDEEDSFYPMRVKKKVNPMRSLRSFVYDHEFSQDFMMCARFASEIKIRKTALNFEQLERFRKLESIYLILKTKYLSLPEEDQKFTNRVSKTLLKLPALKNVILEQEISTANNPFTFMEGLSKTLKGKAEVRLVADFVDASFHKHRDLTIEKVMHRIHELGIQKLKVNYAGVMRVMKRFERVFEAPIHTREDAYYRFIKTIMDTQFKEVQFLPTVHSSHIDLQLTKALIEFMNSENGVKISGLNLMYNLDVINPYNLDLFLDLYNQKVPRCEIIMVSTCDLRKSLTEQIKEHFASVISKIEENKTPYSLTLTAKNLHVFVAMIKAFGTKMGSSQLKSFNVQIIEPLHNEDFQNFLEVLRMSDICKVIEKIQIDFAQKMAPNAQNLAAFLSNIAKDFVKLNKVKICYNTTRDGVPIFKKVVRSIRQHCHKMDFVYEINNERVIYE